MTRDERADTAAGPGDTGGPLQPRNGRSHDPVTDPTVLRQLSEVEGPVVVDRLRRLEADADLIRRLQLQYFDPESAPYGKALFGGISMRVSNARARNELSWKPKYPSISDGIQAQ